MSSSFTPDFRSGQNARTELVYHATAPQATCCPVLAAPTDLCATDRERAEPARLAPSTRYLYHLHPPEMVGGVLYPLNDLRTLNPAIYEREVSKYCDHPSRRELLFRRIPKLGCHWNDVIHCAPIHPNLLYTALLKCGLAVKPQVSFFQIPLDRIVGLPAVIFTASSEDPMTGLAEDDSVWFEPTSYAELDCVPVTTLQWYRQRAREGRLYGHFVGVPHVLVQGPIDVRHAQVISWSSPPTDQPFVHREGLGAS